MGKGDEDSIAGVATARLRLLQHEITEPHTRGAGPSGRTRNPFPAGPIPAGLLDHMRDAYQEAVSNTQAVAPAAGPPPADHSEVYGWMDRSTQDLNEEKRRIIEAVMFRQGLEHGIRAGHTDVVRPIPCPTCGCWSLIWDEGRQRVVCPVDDCFTDGRSTSWSLRDLAVRAVEKSPTRAAT